MNPSNDAERMEAYLSKMMYTLNFQPSDSPLTLMPVAQVRLLRALHSGPKTVTDIAELLNVSPSAASQLITRLANGKYVVRLEDPKDRRIRMIQLAPKGAQLVEQRYSKRTRHAQLLLDGLGEKRGQEFLNLLAEAALICSTIIVKSTPTIEDIAVASAEELSS